MTGPRDDDREHTDEPRPAREFASLEAMRELAAAHALDALDTDERAAFDAAAEESPELRAEADSYAESAAVLGALAEPVEPPSDLKQRLMAQLDGLPQQQPASQSAGGEASTVDSSGIAEPATSAEPIDRPAGRAQAHARRRWFERPGAVIGIAAAAIVLIAGVVVGVGWPGPNGWGAQLEMAAIASAPDAQSQTHEVAGGGEITLTSSAEQQRSGVVVSGLPELDADQTYELWYLDDSGAVSAGTFDVSGDETWRVLEGSFTPGVAVGVTVEPAGGSPQPTTEPIVIIPT
ncbi:anti-sigma factor [Agromyces sp. SYSU K20354]|uniref:anti-sigma factor n=1 Tax=Agromyces cavernae TaxID=2898659 RepID=UPI001E4B6DE0|nr:anti-sigma factor [Agromyces cavernae]MCD2441795.1 anti-sigma factor [Agromyces cavernae]